MDKGICIGCMVPIALLTACRTSSDEGSSLPDDTSTTYTWQDRYSEGFQTILALLSSPGAIGEGHHESLDGYRGYGPQLFRLLCWNSRPEPEARRTLLTQWLCQREDTPSFAALSQELGRLTIGHSAQDLAMRKKEMKEVLATLEHERKERKEEIKRSPDRKIDYGAPLGCEPLDVLASLSRLDWFLESPIFYATTQMRAEIYKRLSVENWEGNNLPARTLLMSLWACEPDHILRTEILIPKIEETAYKGEAGEDREFWNKQLEPLLAIFDESEKTIRRAEIQRMKAPLMTESDKKRVLGSLEELDERVRAIQEEQRAAGMHID